MGELHQLPGEGQLRPLGTSAHAARLPHEVLLFLFSRLRQPVDRTEDAWGPRSSAAQYAALLCAMRVCGPWHAAAGEVFYRVVRPRTEEACVVLSTTLTSNPFLANAVRVVELPKSIMLLSFPAEELNPELRERLDPVRVRLANAVDTIVRVCVRAEDFSLYSGLNEATNAYRLQDLSSTLRCLDLNRTRWVQTYAEDAWLQDFRMALRASGNFYTTVSTCSIHFKNLYFLQLSGAVQFPDLEPGSNLQSTFPCLRLLFLTDNFISYEDLEHLLRGVAGTLEVLSLNNALVTSPGGLSLLNALLLINDITPGTAFTSTLKDLRLTKLTSLPAPPGTIPEFHLGGFFKLAALTHLTLDLDGAEALAHAPPSLVQITVDIPYRAQTTAGAPPLPLLAATSTLRRRVPQWKACAPRLALVRQRGPNRLVEDLRPWQIHCFIAGHFCRQAGVELRTDIWLHPSSVRHCVQQHTGTALPNGREAVLADQARAARDLDLERLL